MAAPTPARSEREPWLLAGLQLAAAVLLAWVLSAAARLPEGLWAVMSALIVARPHGGAALGAGWDRVKGTLIGSAVGIAALASWPRGAPLHDAAQWLGLALVALLAFFSAARPKAAPRRWRPARRSTSSSTTPAARRRATSATGTARPGSRRSTPTC